MMMQYASHTPSGLFLCAFCDMGFTSKPECLAHMQCHLQNDRNDNHPQQHQMMIQEIPEPQMQEQVHTVVTHQQQQHPGHHGHPHHMQQHHEQQTHMVQVETQEHVGAEQVAVVRIYVCGNCKSTFFQESDLAQHMTSHQQLRCNICYGLFESEGHLNQHKMVHKQQALENNVVLSNIPPIATGQTANANVIPHSNEIRNITVMTQKNINRMSNRRQDPTKDRPFACDECGKCYVTKGVLGQHKMTHRGHKPHTCPECNRGFYNKGHLNKHLLIHKGERPFPCNMCDKRFRAKGDRESHMVTHTKIRNFACQDCGKTFLQSSHRAQHWRLHHSGEEARIYACEQCGKSFRNPGNLIQHKMFHKGVRAHKCTDCDKAFVMRYDLKKHMRTHTGEKPYTCDICDRSFARKATMDVHVKKMHKDKKNQGGMVKKPFGCDQCPKKFRKKTLLTKHKKRLHPEEGEVVLKTENEEENEEGLVKEEIDDETLDDSTTEPGEVTAIVTEEGTIITTEGDIKQVHLVETAEGETVPVISTEDIAVVTGVVSTNNEGELIEAVTGTAIQQMDASGQPTIAIVQSNPNSEA
ncbi:gastrula zinc finger protein XlCGF26.1 [Patella vulgata]|uniref:gastrula zinc finger protein XlCGF26.1 n=1 Tax=Patella vulgata TaxID=6465 RepID=UPI0021805DF9|nr:gastrula zinc finger protein XlCGF26.1 [Patella vulgata]XP_050395797.1 gastrula zinc finger protein XlCGF26.1 [Patella vulgata]XP_050395798.1 gastrula zinc finger protein XlCGF26.1 [Patella vulgata]